MTHLSDEQLAAWLDGSLQASEREAITDHLAACQACRADLRDTRRLLAGQAPRRRRILVPLAAAAAVVASLLLIPGVDEPDGPRLRTGSGDSEGLASVPVLPAETTSEPASSVTLRWEAVGDRLDYRVTVTDAAGVPVWSGTSAETRVTLPDDLGLEAGVPYFWFVDVTLPTGEVATSGLQELRLR